jgi:hypothetical protein
MKRPKCRKVDFIVCGRIDDPRTNNAPGSELRKCSECESEVRIHPTTIDAKINVPILCLQCALAKMECSEEEMEERGTRLQV